MSGSASANTTGRHTEWVADLFPVLAVVLLFGTVWITVQFYDDIWGWIRHHPLVAMPVVVVGFLADVTLIYVLLRAGARDCVDGDCFRTFRGRRHGSAGGNPFSHWLKHMERVGKVHR